MMLVSSLLSSDKGMKYIDNFNFRWLAAYRARLSHTFELDFGGSTILAALAFLFIGASQFMERIPAALRSSLVSPVIG